MDPHEIVMREMQRNGCLQVFKLLAESVGQTGKAPHAHTHGQVLPLNQTGRDMPLVGRAGKNSLH
jgi:hypothetical protein